MAPSPAPDTRTRLIEAARTLFHSQGYGYTGIAQILTEAGVHRGSFYHFFASKGELLMAVLETYKELLWPVVLEPVFERTTDPVERVFGVLAGYREGLVGSDCEGGCPIGNLALELSDLDPTARRCIAENFEGWRLAIRGCLEDFPLPGDVDIDRLATFVLTVMEGGIMQARAHKSVDPFDQCVAVLRDYFDRLTASASP